MPRVTLTRGFSRVGQLGILVAGVMTITGCDYWPPALQEEIGTLRTALNDALDEQERLKRELADLQSAQVALHPLKQQAVPMNGEPGNAQIHLPAPQIHPSLEPDSDQNPALQFAPIRRQAYVSLEVTDPPIRSPRVVQVQRLLRRHGIPLRIDGIYGPVTAAAVRGFQRSRGLTADGRANPPTITALRAGAAAPQMARPLWLQRPPLTGRDVRTIQRALRRTGHRLALDGHYGPETDVAVTRFQRKHGLEPDGIVGPRTWKALLGGRG